MVSRQDQFGKRWLCQGTPPPGSTGIMDVAGNPKIIHGAQSVAGKGKYPIRASILTNGR
jgi:hypothetical protein